MVRVKQSARKPKTKKEGNIETSIKDVSNANETINPDLEKEIDGCKDDPVVAPEDDYCLEFLRSLNWNRPIKRTTDMSPWIGKDEWSKSLANKYMNYEMEKNYIDLDNPLFDGPMLDDLRKKESRKKSKKKDVTNAEYSVIKEGVKEVDEVTDKTDGHINSTDSEDDFIDEFGNIRDQATESSEEEKNHRSQANVTSSVTKGKKKRRKRGKGSKTLEKSGSSTSVGAKEVKEEVLTQSKKFFIDYDKAPKEGAAPKDVEKEKPGVSYSGAIAEQGDAEKSQEPQFMTSFHFEEPQNSLLSMKEQRTYMALLDKFRDFSQEHIGDMLRGNNQIQIHDWNVYQEYRKIVEGEQEEFQKWCKDVFVQNSNSGKNYQIYVL